MYRERWEIETALDKLKTHLRGAAVVLRSKTADLVRQECFGLLMTLFAIRGLMHEAALSADEDPDRLSFLHAARALRHNWPAFGLSYPGHACALHDSVLAQILEERVAPATIAATNARERLPRAAQERPPTRSRRNCYNNSDP